MQTSKIGCMQCPRYGECPQQTKLFMNYCGSQHDQNQGRIRTAMLDCHARRVVICKQIVLPPALVRRTAYSSVA